MSLGGGGTTVNIEGTNMARILISVLPASGHVNPLVAIAQALQRNRHEITVATDVSYREQLARIDLDLLPLPYPPGAVGRLLKAFQKPARWLVQLQPKPAQMYFLDHLDVLTAALIERIQQYRPDVLLSDLNFYAGPIAAEVCGLPYASFCAIVNTLHTPDVPLYGLGSDWHPSGDVRRLLWRVLRLPVGMVWGRYDQVINSVRRDNGLKPVRNGMLQYSPYLGLVPTTEAYAYPRRVVPPQIHYVGPVTSANRGETHDDFPWEWLDDERPMLYVSMGTIVGGVKVFQAVIELARGAAWKAVLAVGRNTDVGQFADAPENVLVRNFVPQLAVLKRVDAVISHGGNNTVTDTLLHGLPLVVIPFSADQPESAARVKAAGAGIRIRPGLAHGERLRRAIEAVLHDPAYRQAAQSIQASYVACDGAATSARLVGKLAATGKPVYRQSARVGNQSDEAS